MADTYTLIEKITVGAAGASDVTFTSIPQTYTDLKIVASTRSTASVLLEDMYIRFNGSSASVYSSRNLRGNGSAASSASSSGTSVYVATVPAATNTASTFNNLEIYIPNYTSSNAKSFSVDMVQEANSSTAWSGLISGLWNPSTQAAITSITLLIDTSFAQYSTFYLYGIAKEGVSPAPSSAPYATGGDRILYDGTYWYHAFTSTGTFTPRKGLSCDVLVVAGGGGGSFGNQAGGGGAGGLLAHTAQSVTSGTGYTVTIGAGGAGGTSGNGYIGFQGSNAQFGSLTASVGGGYGGRDVYGTITGGSGGSGGGGGTTSYGGTATGGTATSGQGNNGGTGGTCGAGGGGASAAGANGGATAGGAGGAGSSTYSSWGSATSTGQNVSGTYYFAGGGSGGSTTNAAVAGGNGGGGAGGTANNNTGAASGTANTGGGGGGGSSQTDGTQRNGGTGGSGIVIVRYAA